METIYIFHHNDLDGYSAGAIVYQLYRDSTKYRVYFRKLKFPTTKEMFFMKDDDALVYIVDYSFTDNTAYVLEDVIKQASHVYWYDHHKSSLECEDIFKGFKEKYPSKFDYVLDNDRSGALIAYDELLVNLNEPDKRPGRSKFVLLVDDYDRWVHQYAPEDIALNAGMMMSGLYLNLKLAKWRHLIRGTEEYQYELDEIINNGKTILDYDTRRYDIYMKSHAYECTFSGLKCLVANTDGNSRAFGDLIYQYDAVILWTFNGKDYVYSMYTIQDSVDCSEICKAHGGGGHKGAAGFTSKELLFTHEGCDVL